MKVNIAQQSVSIIRAPRPKKHRLLGRVIVVIMSLYKGLRVTLHYLLRPSTIITQQYPENRETLKMFDRYRGEVVMPHDENGFHKCTGCTICEMACPNGTITITPRKGVDGKNEIDRFIWRMDTCTLCAACVMACPFDAIHMGQSFESTVFDRRLLVFTLNKYAGPVKKALEKLTDPAEQKKLMEPRERYSGPVPLAGNSIDALPATKEEEYPQ
ncbi:MAG: hypothetical protein ACD_73C00079G0001 [uncultured bacterium]|nr:MAG: hypothetical protein ACD_73C00079G0001 [uncultured bacterium]